MCFLQRYPGRLCDNREKMFPTETSICIRIWLTMALDRIRPHSGSSFTDDSFAAFQTGNLNACESCGINESESFSDGAPFSPEPLSIMILDT